MERKLLRMLLVLAMLVPVLSSGIGLVQQSGPRLFSSSSSSSGGSSLTDGGTFTLSGTGLGSSTASVTAYMGGINGPLEAVANGSRVSTTVSLPSGWAMSGGDPTFVSTARCYNGTKCILHRFGHNTATGGSYDDTLYQYGMRFDVGTPFLRAYTRVISYKTGFTDGQVKFQRFTGRLTDQFGSNVGGLQDDNLPNVLLNCYHNNDCSQAQTNDNAALGGNGFTEPNISFGVDPSWVDDGWVLQEYDFIPGTVGTANGSISWRFTNLQTGTVLSSGTASTKRFWQSGDSGYRWWVVQMYMANAAGVDGAQLNIDRDFVGFFNTADANFTKFVVFCNASTYASATICVPQPTVTGWNNTQITGTFNKGALPGLVAGTDFWGYVCTGINTCGTAIVPTTLLMDAVNDPYAFVDQELAA